MEGYHVPIACNISLQSIHSNKVAPFELTNEKADRIKTGPRPTDRTHSKFGVERFTKSVEKPDLEKLENGSKIRGKSSSDSRDSVKKVFKRKAFKPPKQKDNHNNPQYDYLNFPWADLLRKAKNNDATTPDKFEANGPVRRIVFNEDSVLAKETEELFEEGISSEFWKFFGVIKISQGNSLLPILGKIMQYRDDLALGHDYVFHSREENLFGRKQKAHYFLFSGLRNALLGAYLIGGEGDEMCPLVALSKNNIAFNEMFTYENGQIDKLFVTYHDHKWHADLKKLILDMKEDATLLTCGILRNNLAELRYNVKKDAIEKGEVSLDVNQSFLDNYYPNLLHSLHFRCKELNPRGLPRQVWAASFRKKNVLMLNSLNNPIKYFRNYDFKKAEEEVKQLKVVNTDEKKGLSKEALKRKRVSRVKTTDELRRIELDNKFLRTNAREYRLHPRYSLLIGQCRDLYGTMDDFQLRQWRLKGEAEKQPVSILNIKNHYDLGEWSLAQQLFQAGSRADHETVKFLFTMKAHHDKQYRKNAKEIAYVAAFAASNRNEFRHVNETVKLEMQSVRLGIDLVRKENGLSLLYHNEEDVVSESELKKVENQIDIRNEMVNERNGEFPCDNTAKQILSGMVTNNSISNLITKDDIMTSKGAHFRKTDGGFTNEEMDEREIVSTTLGDTQNYAYTNEELNKISMEALEPKAKIRKECDKLDSSLGREDFRDKSFNSDASAKIMPELTLELENPEGSICNAHVATLKKPKTKRIVKRAQTIMKNLNDKVTGESNSKKRCSNKHINIGDNELKLITFNENDFKELAKNPYISINGEILFTLKEHDWPKRRKNDATLSEEKQLHMRISFAEMQRTWYSIALMYPKGVIAILNAVMEINRRRSKDKLHVDTILECADLRNDLEIFHGGLNDATWLNSFSSREDRGRAFCPLPTLLLYNTIVRYLPIIKDALDSSKPKFKKHPSDEQLLKQMIITHDARLEHSPQGKFITGKDSSSRNSQQRRKSLDRKPVESTLNVATLLEENSQNNCSDLEKNRSEYALYLDGAFDYEYYNEWLENFLIPFRRELYEENQEFFDENPEYNINFQNLSVESQKSQRKMGKNRPDQTQLLTSTPSYKPPRPEVFNFDASFIYAEEEKRRPPDMIKVSTNHKLEYKSKEIFERPLGLEINPDLLKISEPIKDEYRPKFTNERVQFQFGDLMRRNPFMPGKNEIEVHFKNHKIKTVLDNDATCKTPPKFYNLSVSYCNINPPIQLKIKKLIEIEPYSKSAFICISEVRTKMELVTDLTVIPLGYALYTHEITSTGLCYALILVKIDLPGTIEVLYNVAPMILIKWKYNGKSLLIGCVYRPHAKSVIYERDFTKDDFADRLEKLGLMCEKPPAVVCGDLNIDMNKIVLVEDKKVRRLIERAFCRFEFLATKETFFRNKDATGTTIDYVFFRKIPYLKHTLVDGRDLIGTDGHMVFNIEFNLSLNGILGTTIIKSRPRLDPLMVSKLGNSLFPALQEKLEQAKLKMFEKYEVEEGYPFSNKKLKSFDDNDYCETAFQFFEQFFSILQPETEKKVNIYNYPTPHSNDLSNLKALYASLKADKNTETDKTRRDFLKKSLKETNDLIEQVKVRDKRANLTGKININDDDFYAIVKALRPKLREVQMTKELFTADELANEYRRVYSGITKHISEAEVTLDILQLCPKINEALKFSFNDWLPTWSSNDACIKNISQCFNSLKAKTRGLNSSLYRDGVAMLPAEYIEIINNMILYWTKGGNYPKKFLGGKLKSILKKGDAKLIKNRRFISVGNFFQQLLGKVTASCVLAYCEFNNLLDDDQYGFRQFRSTDLAVASLHYKVASRNDLCTSILLFIDFSSAFFCVKKDLLIDILSTFINKEAMIFFKNLLQPITATVISDGIESEEIEVPDFGVRQGGGDSPLHFNLCQNMIFKYVSEPMESIYDRNYLNLQGFADDSILIASSVGKENVSRLLEKGLKKVVSYVTSVGFCINPSKSEAMIVCKNKERDLYGEVLKTSQGDIKIKRSNNILGLRLHEKLNFKPQYTHLMAKVVRMRYDLLDLLKIGTKCQLIKSAFQKCSGVYSYGIGVQKVWTKRQYSKAQKEVNDLIRLVYDVKWENENSWRQNDLLRMVDWPPIRIQHAKAALLTLNKVAMNPSLKQLYSNVNHHLRYPNGDSFLENRDRIRRYEDNPLDATLLPVIGLNKEDKKNMSTRVKHAFPLTVNHWFKDLPDFIKILVGTHEFNQAIHVYYKRACWHREESDCSLCKYNQVIYQEEIETFEKLVFEYLEEQNITKVEFDSTFDATYFENYEDTYLDEEDIDFIG